MQTGAGNRQLDGMGAALAVAETSTEALRNAYRFRKESDRRHSLGYLCKKTGMPSTGYLSDVMSGKRLLHKKYWQPIARALALNDLETDYLLLLLKIDHAPKEAENPTNQARLSTLRKSLMTLTLPTPTRLSGFFDALEVFCAFGLFGNRPTRENLVSYFRDSERVERSLRILLDLRLIDAEGGGTYTILNDQILFNEDQGGISHIDFLELSLKKAAEDARYWFSRREDSHFVSSIISVDSKTYREKLEAQKKRILEMQAELESSRADRLIRFNVQVYPIRREEDSD